MKFTITINAVAFPGEEIDPEDVRKELEAALSHWLDMGVDFNGAVTDFAISQAS